MDDRTSSELTRYFPFSNSQTSLDLPTPEDFENDVEGGKLNVAVNGHRLKSIPFEVTVQR